MVKLRVQASILVGTAVILAAVAGCSSGPGKVHVPGGPNQLPGGAFKDLTLDQKIQRIQSEPVPQAVKDKQIADLKAGKDIDAAYKKQ